MPFSWFVTKKLPPKKGTQTHDHTTAAPRGGGAAPRGSGGVVVVPARTSAATSASRGGGVVVVPGQGQGGAVVVPNGRGGATVLVPGAQGQGGGVVAIPLNVMASQAAAAKQAQQQVANDFYQSQGYSGAADYYGDYADAEGSDGGYADDGDYGDDQDLAGGSCEVCGCCPCCCADVAGDRLGPDRRPRLQDGGDDGDWLDVGLEGNEEWLDVGATIIGGLSFGDVLSAIKKVAGSSELAAAMSVASVAIPGLGLPLAAAAKSFQLLDAARAGDPTARASVTDIAAQAAAGNPDAAKVANAMRIMNAMASAHAEGIPPHDVLSVMAPSAAYDSDRPGLKLGKPWFSAGWLKRVYNKGH